MIGPEGAGAHLAGWLVTRLPARLRLIEARLGLAEFELVNPSLVEDHETGPIALEQWPAVYALPQRMTGMRVIETAEGAEAYRVTYAVRLLAWVRSDDYGTTDLLRKRYALAIREALLERKQLTAPPDYAADGYGQDRSIVTVDPASIREDYSGLVTDTAASTIAGAWVDVDVSFTEALEGATPLGRVGQRVDVDTADVPPHPGL